MSESKFVFNEPGMTELTQSWTGTFGTHIKHRSEQLADLGRGSAGHESGALIESIGVNLGHGAGGALESKVGANPGGTETGYGLINHEGSKPHEITPRAVRALRFRTGGMVVFAAKVKHPGTRATKFLTRWLDTLFK